VSPFAALAMGAWHYTENGTGPPLVLLHGIGMSHAAWNAVVPHLSPLRRVIAFDIAGFGATAPLPSGTAPTIPHLVDALAASLDAIGLSGPVDIAGNSLGGGMALEAARRGLAKSVVAISPIGLWKERPPPHVAGIFLALRFMTVHASGPLKAAMRSPSLRELMLALPLSVGSRRMPVADARRAIDDMARARAFDATFESTRTPLRVRDIRVPVTIAFGDRDWILTAGARRRDALPAHATWVTRREWGHVPMWSDPIGVAWLMLRGTGTGNMPPRCGDRDMERAFGDANGIGARAAGRSAR
jgi:pimeloyl-ACP methyl ester carboxylesterase